VDAIAGWGAASHGLTGIWVDRRSAFLGVGIAEGDDIETTETLQALMPPGVTVQVRLVSPAWAQLRQLHVHVAHYLDDEGIWGLHAVSVGVDQHEEHVEVGLLPTTPDEVVARIRTRFPTNDLNINRNASQAVAL
jgi:hypothetical protein